MAPMLDRVGISLVAALALAGLQATGGSGGRSAPEVLAHMEDVYSSCRSYMDSGEVRTTFLGDGDDWVNRAEFSTAFVRPRDFRFEFQNRFHGFEGRHMVWRGASGVRFWDDWSGEIEEVASLGLALAGATGISSGSAHTIPALLLEEVGGHHITEGAVVGSDEADLEGVACHRVHILFQDTPRVLWIDKDRYLLRRIDEKGKNGDTRWESTTTYRPEIDVAVPASRLAFTPRDGPAVDELAERKRRLELLVSAGLVGVVAIYLVRKRGQLTAHLRKMRDRQIGLR